MWIVSQKTSSSKHKTAEPLGGCCPPAHTFLSWRRAALCLPRHNHGVPRSQETGRALPLFCLGAHITRQSHFIFISHLLVSKYKRLSNFLRFSGTTAPCCSGLTTILKCTSTGHTFPSFTVRCEPARGDGLRRAARLQLRRESRGLLTGLPPGTQDGTWGRPRPLRGGPQPSVRREGQGGDKN